MADELKNLRPEVLDALADVQGEADCRCSEPYKSRGMKDPQCNHDLQDSVDIIRAELLRLAQDNHDLIDSLRASEPINREWRERAEKADAERATIRSEMDQLRADAAMFAHAVSLGQRYKQRAEHAEVELAALKARIAGAPVLHARLVVPAPCDGGRYVECQDSDCDVPLDLCHRLRGLHPQRVRLLME